jgi:hypothetical protein
MSGFDLRFGDMNFETVIQEYCDGQGWEITDLNDTMATLKFNMETGRTQAVYIVNYEDMLEFSIPSMAAFDNLDDIPGDLAAVMLRRNATKKIGFWCIEEIAEKQVLSFMYNVEMELLNSDRLDKLVIALITECDEFEGEILDNA